MDKVKKGKTSSGFVFQLDEKRLNNYELVEAISEIEGNPLVFPRLLKLLLGDEAAAALKDHVRDEDGLVSVERMTEEITEIFAHHQVKN